MRDVGLTSLKYVIYPHVRAQEAAKQASSVLFPVPGQMGSIANGNCSLHGQSSPPPETVSKGASYSHLLMWLFVMEVVRHLTTKNGTQNDIVGLVFNDQCGKE